LGCTGKPDSNKQIMSPISKQMRPEEHSALMNGISKPSWTEFQSRNRNDQDRLQLFQIPFFTHLRCVLGCGRKPANYCIGERRRFENKYSDNRCSSPAFCRATPLDKRAAWRRATRTPCARLLIAEAVHHVGLLDISRVGNFINMPAKNKSNIKRVNVSIAL